MTTDRRLYDMDLGRRDHARWLGSSGRYSTRLTLPTTNLLAAYDARVGVTNVSGACSAWADQSGNGFHATQGTAGSRPTITTTGGFASLFFDGADWLNATGMTASAGIKSIYAVVNPTAVGSIYRLIFDAASGRLAFGILETSQWGLFDNTDRSSGITAATGLQQLSAEVVTGSSRVWRNGTVGSTTGWTASSAIGGTVAIGCRFTGAQLFFTGHILALFIYNAARNTAVEDYITQEWGV